MKNFLALDTSGSYLTVIAEKEGERFSTFLPDCAMKHSVSWLTAVEETLKKANMSLSDCDFFGVVVGAGSFTGIRIGISAIKGFCLAYQKPALPVTSFDLTAYADKESGKTLCLVDALHDCYYACGYENGEVVYPPAFLTQEEVLALQKEGYALRACAKMPIETVADLQVVDPVEGFYQAVYRLSAKEKFGEPVALYVRKSSAELNAQR